MLYAIVAVLVIILDQWMKLWVFTNIQPPVAYYELIPGTLSLVNVKNDGAAFSLLSGSNASIIFIAVAGAVALLVIIALATNLVKGQLGRWSLVFIAAGGLSNAIDRIMWHGEVQDMIKLDFLENVNIFGLKGINFPIFNLADVFIVVFCFLFILYVLFGGKRKEEDFDDEDEEDEDEEEELLDEDEEEDEDDEEDDDARPLRRKFGKKNRAETKKASAKARKNTAGYEEDYERFKARKAKENPAPPAETPAPVVDPADPFAEWDKARARVEKSKESSVAAQEAPKSAPAPVQEAPKSAPAPAPAAPKSAPAPAPAAPKSAPAAETEEYSLEDILAEFR